MLFVVGTEYEKQVGRDTGYLRVGTDKANIAGVVL